MKRAKTNQPESAISKTSDAFTELSESDSVSQVIPDENASADSSSFNFKFSTPDSQNFGVTIDGKTQEDSPIGGTMALLIRLLMVSFLICEMLKFGIAVNYEKM